MDVMSNREGFTGYPSNGTPQWGDGVVVVGCSEMGRRMTLVSVGGSRENRVISSRCA
jgi:hypothetical protein